MKNSTRLPLQIFTGLCFVLLPVVQGQAQVPAGITPNSAQVTGELSPAIAQKITGDPNSGALKLAPEVSPDRKITFHFVAPRANTVQVSLEGQPAPLAMTRDEKGLWSVTSPTLPPQIYGYHYIIDGAHVLDPLNRWMKSNLLYEDNMLE